MFDALPRLIARADWQKPEAYPDPDMDNSDLWAWEFLRRNQSYAEDIERLAQLKPFDREALRLRWEVSQLVSPEVAWHQLLPDFRFLANIAEIIEPTMPLGNRNISGTSMARLATEQSTLATSRQILVRLTLDGNIDSQSQDLKQKYWQRNHHHPETGKKISQAVTQIVIDDVKLADTEIETLPDGSQITRYVYENNWDDTTGSQIVFFYDEEQKRVQVKHLFFALRCVDAMAAYYAIHPNSDRPIEEVIEQVARLLLPKIREEWDKDARYVASLAAGDLHRVQLHQVKNWITYGLHYTQEERYREIASSDLRKQLNRIKNKDTQ